MDSIVDAGKIISPDARVSSVCAHAWVVTGVAVDLAVQPSTDATVVRKSSPSGASWCHAGQAWVCVGVSVHEVLVDVEVDSQAREWDVCFRCVVESVSQWYWPLAAEHAEADPRVDVAVAESDAIVADVYRFFRSRASASANAFCARLARCASRLPTSSAARMLCYLSIVCGAFVSGLYVTGTV